MNELKTIIALRRDTEAKWSEIQSSFKPMKGEVCFIDTSNKGLRAKVGNGEDYLVNLPFTDDVLYNEIDSVVINGYYLNNKFWTDSTYTIECEKSINKIYIDHNTNVIYWYDGSNYVSVNDTLPTASDVVAGIMKLYNTSGTNEDGTMTQKSITNGVSNIKFNVDPEDSECLVLDLPW